jgi:hypothetical protein
VAGAGGWQVRPYLRSSCRRGRQRSIGGAGLGPWQEPCTCQSGPSMLRVTKAEICPSRMGCFFPDSHLPTMSSPSSENTLTRPILQWGSCASSSDSLSTLSLSSQESWGRAGSSVGGQDIWPEGGARTQLSTVCDLKISTNERECCQS